MKKIFVFFIVFFAIFISNAQVKDSVRTIPGSKITNGIDLIKVKPKVDLLNFDKLIKDSSNINKYVAINRALLDSLLSPFYVIYVDSIYKDSVNKNIRFIPKYRKVINAYTLDTSFVPIPKTKELFTVKKTLGINPLIIKSPIVASKIVRTKRAKDPVWWKNKNSIGIDINEVAFINWRSGGSNSISGLLKIHFERNFEKIHTLWENKISARYGLNEQEGKGLIKTDDEIRLSSSFGYRKDSVSNWYYSVKFNFNSQFTNGYKYPDTDNHISRFFAPAYVFLGVGTKYNLKPKNFSIYLSPVTLKSTYVLDENLSNEGAFGVDKGKKSRHEFGALVQSSWVTEVFKNVVMTNQLSLYTDYLNDFGNIDVDWILRFQFKINDFLEANLRTHTIYDDDIKFETGTDSNGETFLYGARVQLKQQLGIGILYRF